jgi:transcription elongation GreA/GreB family factor
MRVPTRKGTLHFQDEGGEFHLTAEAVKRLQRQLADAESQVFAVAEEKQRAAALGDRSENAEYQDAKAKLSRLNSRIVNIKDRLNRASVIQKGAADGVVDIGATVTVEIAGVAGSLKTYDIVGQFETDPLRGRISNKSPLGLALIGHVKGDVVKMQTPKGEIEYLIREVK